jgi:hypothetical protein
MPQPKLLSRYNEKASSIRGTLENRIHETMSQHFKGLIEIRDHFHLITPNSYSMPSLLELTWDFCEKGEYSELVQFLSVNFWKLPNSNFGWVLSRDVRSVVITADFIVTSSTEQLADSNVIIPPLKSIGQSEGMATNFNAIKSIREELDSLIIEFSDNITDLSEQIDLTVTD